MTRTREWPIADQISCAIYRLESAFRAAREIGIVTNRKYTTGREDRARAYLESMRGGDSTQIEYAAKFLQLPALADVEDNLTELLDDWATERPRHGEWRDNREVTK